MTHDAQKYEKIFSGTKEVAENLKIQASKLQPWIDAHVPGACLLYTSPSPRDRQKSRMPSSA